MNEGLIVFLQCFERTVLVQYKNTVEGSGRLPCEYYACRCVGAVCMYVCYEGLCSRDECSRGAPESISHRDCCSLFFHHPPSFHVYSPFLLPKKNPISPSPLTPPPSPSPSPLCLCFSLCHLASLLPKPHLRLCPCGAKSSGSKRMGAILFYGTATSKFPSV